MDCKILWLTGLSGSGKTTLAKFLKKKLLELRFKVKIVDGDQFRNKNKNKNSFTKKNIYLNNLAIIENILDINNKYDYIIVSVISPLLKSRLRAKKIFKEKYKEIYVKCSTKELIRRDTKNLYKLARENKIKNLIGFNSKINYEKSKYKKITIDTQKSSIVVSTNKILKEIFKNEKKI